MGLILTRVEDTVGTVALNHPEKRNSLSQALLKELVAAFADLAERKVRVVVLRAAPEAKVWSAGFAIDELPDPGRDPLPYSHPLEATLRAVQDFPGPVIGLIQGGVWGGACDLAFVCDLLIGTPESTFAITPAKMGVPYNTAGILHFLNVVGMHIAKEMLFTAEPLSAERAHQVGILNHVRPAGEIEAFTYDLARRIGRLSPLSIAVIKEQLHILGNATALSPETFERLQALRRRIYDSNDYREGKAAFLEKRRPAFKGD
ncbi:MAG: methylmalonyl-CoA decarboxylase [Thermodesulfobacteriota bacterium]